MKELTVKEIEQVNGGFFPLLVFIAGEALYGYGAYQTFKWLGSRNIK